jgi:hypothetical protein
MNPLFKLYVGMTPEQYAAFSNKVKAATGVTLKSVKGEIRYRSYIFKYTYNNTKLIIDCLSTPKYVSKYALMRKIAEVIPACIG